jgi:DNA replication protein DnaC
LLTHPTLDLLHQLGRPTGVGKSWLASALGHKACRDNRSVLYQRIPKLFADLALARGDGRYARIQRALGGVQLLILDDWGLEPLDAAARHDLLEILEERYGRRSTIITSQIPIDTSDRTRVTDLGCGWVLSRFLSRNGLYEGPEVPRTHLTGVAWS